MLEISIDMYIDITILHTIVSIELNPATSIYSTLNQARNIALAETYLLTDLVVYAY